MTETIEVKMRDIQLYGYTAATWLAYLRTHKRCTYEQLSRDFGITRSSAQNCLARMENSGMVQRLYADITVQGKPPLIGVKICL